jgi:hypothetical protein
MGYSRVAGQSDKNRTYPEQTPVTIGVSWVMNGLAGRETLYGNFIESDRGNLKE